MDESNFAPMYNLKAVVRETGLKPDTLRAWERRYGLPEPRRTPSGHRLYSERDISILKWLISRQQEGLSISRAIALWHQLQEEGNDPLATNGSLQEANGIIAHAHTNAESGSLLPANAEVIDQLRQRWLFACLDFDEQQAEQIFEEAFALFSVERVCFSLLQQGLAEIGIGWLSGNITPQQEHFASSLAMRKLQSLLASTPAPIKREPILVGCPPEETHVFSPTLLTLLLRRRGWNVIFLGANVPVESIQETIANTRPALIVLGAQQVHTAATLLELAIALSDSSVPLAFGGRIFSQNKVLQERIPGHFLGEQLDHAVHSIEKILQMPKHEQNSSQTHFDAQASDLFEKHRSRIESTVRQSMESVDIDHNFLTAANASLGRTIRARLLLQLEAEHLLGCEDQHWLYNTLPSRYPTSKSTVSKYFGVYAEAIQTHLEGDAGASIAQWLLDLKALEATNSTAPSISTPTT